jgi:hypothetical protein
MLKKKMISGPWCFPEISKDTSLMPMLPKLRLIFGVLTEYQLGIFILITGVCSILLFLIEFRPESARDRHQNLQTDHNLDHQKDSLHATFNDQARSQARSKGAMHHEQDQDVQFLNSKATGKWPMSKSCQVCARNGPAYYSCKEWTICFSCRQRGHYSRHCAAQWKISKYQLAPKKTPPPFQRIIRSGINKFIAQSGLPKMPLQVGPREAKVRF